MKKILVINGHPRSGSLSQGLAESYVQGAKDGGHEVVLLHLKDMTFDPILREKFMTLEPDLVAAQDLILNSQHIVIFSPMWWFGTPALLKGFFDRILTSGFAFRYRPLGWFPHVLPRRLLKGRSARVVITHDAFKPLLGILGNPYWRAIKWGTLWYCGFSPVRKTAFSRVFLSTPAKREEWLKKVYQLGLKGK